MTSSNNRFGRRTGRQNDDARSEPVLSFNPKRPGAQRDAGPGVGPSIDRKPPPTPRADRANAAELGVRFGRDKQNDPIPSFMRGSEPGPRVDRDDAEEFGMAHDGKGDRHDDFDPRAPRKKAMEPRVPAGEKPLYHHLFDEDDEKRGAGLGWAAALGSAVLIVVGAAYAWHNFMARPTPGNLFGPPGIASRGPDSGYTTPSQPTDNTGIGSAGGAGQDIGQGATPSPLAATPPDATAPATRDVAATPQPKDIPAEAPPPPKKSISEVAANPGNLGPAVTPPPATSSATPPAVKQPAAAPAPILTPPPKREAAKPDTTKHETPRKEAAITPPKPAPAPVPQNTAPQDTAPPAVAQPAAAPAVTAPPRPRPPSQANGRPQPLNGDTPAAYPPPQQQAPQPQPQPQPQQTYNAAPSNFAPPSNIAPNNAAPSPNGPDTVTIDGVTYVNGQEPHALGTLGNGSPQASASGTPMPPGVPSMPTQSAPQGYSTRSYAPADHDGGAPLPNDVIILPNGRMAVPNGQ